MIPTIFLSKKKIIQYELQQDKISEKFSKNQLFTLGNLAWERGISIAKTLDTSSICDHIYKYNITTITKEPLPLGNHIIFSSYNSFNNEIVLYEKNINEYFIPFIPSEFSKYSNYLNSTELICCHELFHYLEFNKVGLTSDIFLNNPNYKRTLYSLSEIAAHSFTKEIFKL